jgi:ADP-heptose:LPS heptosyltransferase
VKDARKTIEAAIARSFATSINAVLRAVAWLLWPRRPPDAPERVCIYRVGTIGDIVCALPAIYAIRNRWPHASLTFLNSPGPRGAPEMRDLLEGLGWFDEIVTYHNEDLRGARGIWNFIGELRRRRFDAWIELPGVLIDVSNLGRLLRNMIVARAASRWARGWEIGTIKIFRQAQSEVLELPDEVERLLGIVHRMGISPIAAPVPLPLSEAVSQRAMQMLEAAGATQRPLVGIAPGAKAAANHWPAGRFAEVARYINEAGFVPVVLGGPGEFEVGEKIARESSGINLSGRTSVGESCAILARCQLLICIDSGVQHLAAAMGIPCVSLFAARGLGLRWRPHGRQHVVIRKMVPCHTCLLTECPYDNHCMRLISQDEVIEAVLHLLGEPRPVAAAPDF